MALWSDLLKRAIRGAPAGEGMGAGPVPESVREAFSTALSQSTYLPAALLLIGALTSALFIRNGAAGSAAETGTETVKTESLTR